MADHQITTLRVPTDIRMRLRFICSQYSEDTSRFVQTLRAKVDVLRAAGVAVEALQAAQCETEDARRAERQNREALSTLFGAAVFVPVAGKATVAAAGAAYYDNGGQVLRCLARDWTTLGDAARAQSLDPVLGRLEQHLGTAAPASCVYVPGCGLGRLALEAASRLGCAVVANDDSAAMIAAFSGLLRGHHVRIFPALSSASAGLARHERFIEVEASMPVDIAGAASSITLEHGDFTADGCGSSYQYDAVVTLFVLDTVASLPASIAAVARLLRRDGIWVNYGPLKKHVQAESFTFDDVAALAEASGLSVVEDTRLEGCEYVPRTVALGARDVYDAHLLVAHKRLASDHELVAP